MKLIALILLAILTTSCNSQTKEGSANKLNDSVTKETTFQIGNYVTSAFEDSKGNLWFGTLEKGMARYDGTELKYFTTKDGLPSNRAVSLIEDSKGVYWLGTGEGLSKFDGQKFTNFIIKKDDWRSNMVNQLFIDSKGQFWIGTWGGVYKFDGKEFTPFPIPYPEVKTIINKDTKDWITEITEDAEGNMWFARDGYGACKFDGESFVYFLKKDGLHSNNVTEIEFDEDGSIWFGTRVAERDNPDPEKRKGKGGVNKLINNKMISFPDIEAFNKGDVYEIQKGTSGNIWISTTKNGVYKYNGKDFKNYAVPISIMAILNDKQGNVWLAGAGGLYKINQKDEIINVTTEGPWE
ncbi:MAG: two-component regulator propeller domain-containing protein [Saprospiraceae bacterium]